MPRASPRKNFHSSNLIRVLSDLALVETREPGNSFAEELGLWLNLDDAITLHAVHAARITTPLSDSGSTEKIALNEEFVRLRTNLVMLDWPGGATKPSGTRPDRSTPQSSLPIVVPAPTYEPYRRHYLDQQRTMDASIRTFRIKVRDVLTRTSPTLAKLANLDAVFDGALSERERKLFSMIPSLLETRFKHGCQVHQQTLAATPGTDSPAFGANPAPWLVRFCREMQAVLLAELDARLEPTLGLIEAFNLETTQHS